MINVYEAILSDPAYFKQLAVKDSLLVNYQYPQMEDWAELYSHFNHIIYTTGGKKLLVSPGKSCLLTEGKLVFLKKGAIKQGKFFNVDWHTIFSVPAGSPKFQKPPLMHLEVVFLFSLQPLR